MNKVLSVRLPETLYRQAEQLAKNREISLNSLITQAVEQVTTQAEEQEFYEAFSRLGKKLGSQIEYAMPTQRKHALALYRGLKESSSDGE